MMLDVMLDVIRNLMHPQLMIKPSAGFDPGHSNPSAKVLITDLNELQERGRVRGFESELLRIRI